MSAQCLQKTSEQMKAKSEQLDVAGGDQRSLEVLQRVKPLPELLRPLVDKVCEGLSKMGKILPEDAGPEDLAVLLDTKRSCEKNVLLPMDLCPRSLPPVVGSRNRCMSTRPPSWSVSPRCLTSSGRGASRTSDSSALAERCLAALTAARALRPQVTDADAAYFRDLRRHETTCNK